MFLLHMRSAMPAPRQDHMFCVWRSSRRSLRVVIVADVRQPAVRQVRVSAAWRKSVPRPKQEVNHMSRLPDGCRMSDPDAPWNKPDDDAPEHEPDYDESHDREAEDDQE